MHALACLAAILAAGTPAPAAAERGGHRTGVATRLVEPLPGARTGDAEPPAPTRVVDAALSPSAAVPAAAVPASPLAVPDAPAGTGLSCRWPGPATLAAILPVATDHGSRASGVVFTEGRVLTAAHAVQGARAFYVELDGDYRAAELLSVDHEADLAVLSIDTRGIRPIALAEADPDERQPVWAAGYPRAKAMATSVGVFQKLRDGALHTSAPIDSGQSGGGLLACSRGTYRLAGLLRGYGAYLSGDRYVKLENHSVSVAATTIHHFLDAYR